jgi:eukaryotic-like serine/threonine-protein kinase
MVLEMIDSLSCVSSDHQSNTFLGRSIGEHDRYLLEAQLGEGGMGDVYQALDTRLGKVVAIKLLKITLNSESTAEELDLKRRFERECAICAALKNKHIVQVSDYGITTEGYPFYVMEYLEGQTLKQILRQEQKLSVERAIDILIQICDGLKAAHAGVIFKTPNNGTEHRVKIVHRDLKPANIFIVQTENKEQVKVIDFGVAKIQSPHLNKVNRNNLFLGTYHYAAPEQLEGKDQIDERTDIYCLGIVLYEMLAGVDPFCLTLHEQHITGKSWIDSHLNKAVYPLRSQPGCEKYSVELEQIVMRCLSKSPDQRFPSVQALAQALNKSDYFLSVPHKVLDINTELIHKCQTELVNHIGPIAKIIIEQTLRDTYRHQTSIFLEALANQIPDTNAANHFRNALKIDTNAL